MANKKTGNKKKRKMETEQLKCRALQHCQSFFRMPGHTLPISEETNFSLVIYFLLKLPDY